MKRKFIFLVMLFALLGGVNWNVLNAQETETITVGVKDNTDARIPVHTWYNYSYTQQIYKARDINHSAGDVLKIAFHGYITNFDRKVRVYMLNTTKSYFESLSDWVAISESDLVYDGVLSTSSTLMEIELDKPFEYNGGNILLCVQDYTKQCPKSTSFEVSIDYDGQNCTLLALDDGTQPGPDYLTGASHELAKLKNVLDITFSLNAGPVVPVVPAAPVVNAEPTGQNTIYLSWNSVYKATSYNVYEGDNLIAEDITNTYFEVSGLTANTTYTYTVTAENEVGTSEKSNEASATTWPLAPSSAPANLKADNVDYSYVTLSWDAVTSAEYYTVYCNGSVLTEVDVTTYTVANLSEDTEYTFTVTASNISGTSPASEALTVKTAKFNGRIIVFELNDYYGSGNYDGWNGNKLKVEFNDGTPSVVYTNNGGASSEFYEIPVSYGTTVTITYLNEGSYGSENTYYIRYKDDNYLIHADGRAVTNKIPSTEPYSFIIELPAVQNLTATPAQIQKGQSTTISWEAYEGAATYNIYVNDELKGNTAEQTYQLSEIPYDNEIAVVAVDANGDEISGSARISVKVVGTFTLKLHVVNAEGVAIEGATVSFDTESFYNEFYELVPAIESMTTDSDGMIDIELPLPCEYGSPQWQYSSLGAFVTKEFYQTEEYWITSGIEVNDGGTIEKDIELKLAAPVALTAEDGELLAGEDLELSWDAVTGAIGYNVYKQGEWNDETESYDYDKLNDEMITGTAYTVEDVEYGMWVEYAVTAVYAIGESGYTTTPVSVTGMGSVSGTVTDGAKPVKGVKVVLTGKDAFYKDQTYTYTTDANGEFTGKVMVGSYTATATRYDFEDYTSNEQVVVNYNETASVNIAMTSYPSATINNVSATEADGNALVTWEEDYEKYNVYRRNVETDAIEKLATETTLKQYTDAQWASLDNGTYQYGVSTYVGGENTEIGVIFNENFDNGEIPAGWSVIANGNFYWYVNGGQAYSSYANGDITTYLVTPLIDIKNATTLKFDYLSLYYTSASRSDFYVRYSTSAEGPWSEPLYENTFSNSYQTISVDLSSIENDNVYFAFCNNNISYGGNGIYLDNIVVEGLVSSEKESTITWSNELVKKSVLTLTFNNAAGDNNWNNPDNWVGGSGNLPTAEDNVVVNAVANITGTVAVNNLTINARLNVMPEAAFTVNGTITDANEYGNLYIEDGAQIFQKNEGVNACFRMNIKNPNEWSKDNKEGWQFISSPLLGAEVTAAATKSDNDYNASDYDLYKYNGSSKNEWVNHKNGEGINLDFEVYFTEGLGYMYSHKARTIVTLGGTLNPARTFDYEVSYNGEENPLANFHLLGNPFTFNMDWQYVNVSNVYDGYATLNDDGDDYVYATEGTIAVGDGFFVQTIGENPEIGYANVRGSKETSANINVIARGNTGEDNVIINFAGEGEGFRKLQGFNEDNAHIFVENEGRRYGIANVEANATEVELSFVAAQMGNYTISLDVNGKFETVVLVDRFTGVETNMLLEDEYSFTATSNDSPNRFVVRLGGAKTESASFVYQSGDELIINAEGAIEIIDMMGRVVYSSEANVSRVNVSNFNNAAYVVRALNEGKVQKVVIY